MRHNTERVVGVALLTAVALGATACETNPGQRPLVAASQPTDEHIKHTDFNPQLRAVAAKILSGYRENPHPISFETKPPYSVGYAVQLQGGAELSFEFQSPTKTPDPEKVEMVDVQETVSGKLAFDILFYTRDDGSMLNAYCDAGTAGGVDVIDQLSVQSRPHGFNGSNASQGDMLTGAILRKADAFASLANTAHDGVLSQPPITGVCLPIIQ